MGRSLLMRRVRRAMAIANYADHQKLSTRAAMERLQESVAKQDVVKHQGASDASRRSFLKGAAAFGAAGALLLPRRALSKKASQSTARIAVVGAGMGGLSCAYNLYNKGVYADVFDAAGRVGGRVHSLGGAFPGPIAVPGQVTELGGEFIDTGHSTMRGYANEFGFALEDVLKSEVGDPIFFVDGEYHTEEDVVDHYRDFVPAMQADLRDLSPHGPTADGFSPEDLVLDYTNLDDYLVTRGASPFFANLIRETYRNEYGRDVSEQCCLNFLLLIHADMRSNWQPWGVFSDERFHVVGGTQQIPAAIAGRLGSQVKLGHRLMAARKNSDGSFRLTFNNGATVELDYDYVVFAMPFTTLRNVSLDASLGLPAYKTQVINNLQYGTNAKMIVAFNGRPWNDVGFNGSMVTHGIANLNSGWESNPLQGSATSAVYVEYSGGSRGANLDPNNPAGEATAWLAAFEQVVPGATAKVRRDGQGNPVATIRHWPSDPNHLGAYTCNQPGYFTTMADNEAKRVGNLMFAGEHVDSFYAFQGWMEGAAVSGNARGTEIVKELQKP